MTEPVADAEWRRLAAATSMIDRVRGQLEDLTVLRIKEVEWLADLEAPDQWSLSVAPDRRIRIGTYGQLPQGGWTACDTVSVFAFTGALPAHVLYETAERMLRDLDAVGSRTYTPNMPALPEAAAVRSSGYITVGGRRMWARFNVYVAGSSAPGQGRLVQHSHFVDAETFFHLGADIGILTRAVQDAFWATITPEPAPAPARLGGDPMNANDPESSRTTLTERERKFLLINLRQWRSAATGKPLPIKALGIADNWPEFDRRIERLMASVEGEQPLSESDWTLVLYLTEQAWASTLVGSGLDIALVSDIPDDEAIKILRSIQWKLVVSGRASGQLLFPDEGRPVKPLDDGA